METLDLALIHEQALILDSVQIPTAAARKRIIKRAKSFFAEVIIPTEQTHRAAVDANIRLNLLNRKLNRRTLDLAASNRS